MQVSMILIGFVLMLLGGFFTVITFGFGIVCTWPLILLGFVLFVLGFLIPRSSHYHHSTSEQQRSRYCPYCGRTIPFDARVCPYCKKDFELKTK